MPRGRIGKPVKLSLVELVLRKEHTIKQAANALNINYSSAKSVISVFRKRHKLAPQDHLQRQKLRLVAKVETLKGDNNITTVSLLQGLPAGFCKKAVIKTIES